MIQLLHTLFKELRLKAVIRKKSIKKSKQFCWQSNAVFIRFCSCYQFPDKMDFLLLSRTWFTHIFVLCVFFIVRQTPRKVIWSTKPKLLRFNEGIVIHIKSHKFISRSYATFTTYDVHQFWKYSYHPKQLKVYDNFLIKIMTALQ